MIHTVYDKLESFFRSNFRNTYPEGKRLSFLPPAGGFLNVTVTNTIYSSKRKQTNLFLFAKDSLTKCHSISLQWNMVMFFKSEVGI
jgi:hypothetical protein